MSVLDVIDRRALGDGILTTALIVGPPGIYTAVVGDGLPEGLRPLFALVMMAGFVTGGRKAALATPDTPLTHGSLAALGGYLAIQIPGIIARLARDAEIAWFAIVFLAIISSTLGMVGGLLALRSQSRAAREEANPA